MPPDITDGIVMDTDPDADLSGADFGNTLPGEVAESAKPAESSAPARGADGKFVKGDATAPAVDGSAVAPAGDGTSTGTGEGDATAPAVDGSAVAPAGDGTSTGTGEGDDSTSGGKGKAVPYARFKEVVDQRNAYAAQAAAAAAASAQTQRVEVDQVKALNEKLDGLYEQVETMRAEADTKGAAKVQREIDATNREIGRIQASADARQQAIAVQENVAYDSMLEVLEAVEPVMDPNSPEYDRDTVQEMEFQVKAYTNMGMPPTQALRRAAVLVFREDPFAKGAGARAAANAEAAVAPSLPSAKPTNVAKNVAAAKKTPPEAQHHTAKGDSAGMKSINDMTDEELSALPASVVAKMRGDTL